MAHLPRQKPDYKPPEDFLAVIRALAKRAAREDHAAEVARQKRIKAEAAATS